MHNNTAWVGDSNLTDCSHKYYTFLHLLWRGKKINSTRSLLPYNTFSANQLKFIYMPKNISLMIKRNWENLFVSIHTHIKKKIKLLLYYNLESLHFISRIWHWNLSYDRTKTQWQLSPQTRTQLCKNLAVAQFSVMAVLSRVDHSFPFLLLHWRTRSERKPRTVFE